MRRFVVVVAMVGVFVGLFPQPRAEAFAPPIPIAPPITGLCATPWGALACFAVVGVGGELAAWVTNSGGLVGWGPFGSEGEWCLTDTGHMFAEGSGSCSGSIAVETPGGTIDQLADLFTGSDPEVFDQYGVYRWTPVGDPCHEGICVEFALTRQVGRGVEYLVVVDGSEGNACEGGPIQHGSSVSGSAILATFDAPCYFASAERLFSGQPIGPDAAYLVHSELEGECGFPGATSTVFTEVTGDGPSLVRRDVTGSTDCHRRMVDAGIEGVVAISEMSDTGVITDNALIEMERQGAFEGQYKTTTACRAEDGTVTVRTETGPEPFVVGAAAGSMPLAGCLPGEIPISTQVELCDIHSPACVPVVDWQLPPDITGPQLECVHNMTGPNPCPMWLEYWNGSQWLECEPATAGPCTDWWTNPGRDVLFRCGWGGDYFSASQCQVLKEWYNVDAPEPETEIIIVNPVDPTDPGIDAPLPNPDPDTGHLPGTITGPGTPPASRPTGNWLQRMITEWSTGAAPGMQNACWPTGWGLLNPLQWIMRPIMCALTFLFVPSDTVELQLEEFWTEATTTTKLGLVTDAGALVGGVGTPTVGGACGWGIPSTNIGVMTIPETQLILCPSDYGLASTASTARGWGFGVVGVWVLGMVYRWIGLGRSDELAVDSDNVTGNL